MNQSVNPFSPEPKISKSRSNASPPCCHLTMNSEPLGNPRFRHSGFTILEVLIALTASLLLMLGLARTYKLLGDKITERQSEMDLSTRLRDIAIRMRDELRRATCEMNPPASEQAAEGYLVYHEGPFTDTTMIQGSVPHPTPRNVTFFPDSRYGDVDDYLAFTARAREGAPFMGFIPRGVLDAVRWINMPSQRATIVGPYASDPLYGSQLVPFYSEVAEIAYWVSPEWQRAAYRQGDVDDGTLFYDNVPDGAGNASFHPVYQDRNQDLLPDKLNLHRRVLLVRPDLNVTPAEMRAANGGATLSTPLSPEFNVPTIPFLIPNPSGGYQVVPISDVTGTNQTIMPNPAGNATVQAPGLWDSNSTSVAPNWLAGIARLQQVMDLSVSRVTDSWSLPTTAPSAAGTFGMPTAIVQANSLADLTRPENRFAHVRVPESIISGTPGSSMAQLALSPPHPYLIAREFSPADMIDPNDPLAQVATSTTTFPHQADAPVGSAPGGTKYLNRYGRFTLKSFLRPEFNLADRVTDEASGVGTPIVSSINRGGTDIIATDVVGFNIQVFDPNAPRYVWMGPDGAPGTLNVNDDDLGANNSPIDDVDELGWPGSDDEVVTVNDPRIDEVLVDNGNRSLNDWNQTPALPFVRVNSGDFVDLGYMHLAGGPMRGLFQFDESGTALTSNSYLLTSTRAAEFVSPFSGFTNSVTVNVGPPPANAITRRYSFFPVSWENSGRMILRTASGNALVSSFYQPVYDTWTDSYLTDPFDQEGLGYGTTVGGYPYALEIGGVTPSVPPYTETRSTQATASNATPSPVGLGRNVVVRRWTSLDGGFNNAGQFSNQDAGGDQSVFQYSPSPFQVTPPVPEPLRAIKISIRLNDFGAETIRQQTVIQEF